MPRGRQPQDTHRTTSLCSTAISRPLHFAIITDFASFPHRYRQLLIANRPTVSPQKSCLVCCHFTTLLSPKSSASKRVVVETTNPPPFEHDISPYLFDDAYALLKILSLSSLVPIQKRNRERETRDKRPHHNADRAHTWRTPIFLPRGSIQSLRDASLLKRSKVAATGASNSKN